MSVAAPPLERDLAGEIAAAAAGDVVALSLTLASGQRVEFGRGALERLPAVVAELGPGPVGLVAGPSQVRAGRVDALAARLTEPALAFTDVRPHAPAELCAQALRRLGGCGAIVALGGGSALGIAKAVAARLEVPLVAVPGTYAGSELTALYGITEGGVKRVRRDPRALPAAIVYDPAVTDALGERPAGASLLNCLAHCIECTAGGDARLRSVGALGGRLAADGLRRVRAGADAAGRDRLLLAGLCGGVALAGGRTGVHHAICHAVGGRTGASHGEINAVVLPAVLDAAGGDLRATATAVVAPLRALDGAPAGGSDADVLRALRDGWDLPRRLRDLGIAPADAGALARQVVRETSMQPWSRSWTTPPLTTLLKEMI